MIVPKNLPKYLEKPINDAIPMAYGFLASRYGWKFNDVVLVIQPNASRSRYYSKDNPRERNAIYGKDVAIATIKPHSRLWLYEKKSLGSYKNGVYVGYTVEVACAIIHELTHHVQHVEKRKRGELETTKNELDFLRVSFPDVYKLIAQ